MPDELENKTSGLGNTSAAAGAGEKDSAEWTGRVEQGDTLEQLIAKKRYQSLKSLLLKEERERIDPLEHYFQNPSAHAEKLSGLLAEAISRSDIDSVHNALHLKSTIQKTVINSIEKNAALYADALYPIIFPAIKKSITEAIKEMMQMVNAAIEQSLSLDRVAWHVEALRSGVPYREVVLKHTLTYQVEQVFLIHRETGLLLRHSALAGLDSLRDGDAVSSMLTAIQDFVKDSFALDESNSDLETVEIGGYTVYLTRGSQAVLACVIRGMPPVSLRGHFEEILYDIHEKYNNPLLEFDGDSSNLESTDEELQQCLLSEKKKKGEEAETKLNPLYYTVPLLFALISWGAYWAYTVWDFKKRTQSYLETLHNTPGIVVTSKEYEGKHLLVKALYDPLLENELAGLAKPFKLSGKELNTQWVPYQSLETDLVRRRMEKLLQPPKTVKLAFKDNTLYVEGYADQAWMDKLNLYASTLAGVSRLDTRHLKPYQEVVMKTLQAPESVDVILEDENLTLTGSAPLDWINTLEDKFAVLDFIKKRDISGLKSYRQFIDETLQAPETVKVAWKDLELSLTGTAPVSWIAGLDEKLAGLRFLKHYEVKINAGEELRLRTLAAELEQFQVYFGSNEANLDEAQQARVRSISGKIEELLSLGGQLGLSVKMVLTGHTDSKGSLAYNTALAQKRAAHLMNFLRQRESLRNLDVRIKSDIPSEEDNINADSQRKVSLKFVFESADKK